MEPKKQVSSTEQTSQATEEFPQIGSVEPEKSGHKKLIIGIIILVLVIAGVACGVFFLLNSNSAEKANTKLSEICNASDKLIASIENSASSSSGPSQEGIDNIVAELRNMQTASSGTYLESEYAKLADFMDGIDINNPEDASKKTIEFSNANPRTIDLLVVNEASVENVVAVACKQRVRTITDSDIEVFSVERGTDSADNKLYIINGRQTAGRGETISINATGYINNSKSPAEYNELCIDVPDVKEGDKIAFKLPLTPNSSTYTTCYNELLVGEEYYVKIQ